MEFDGFDFDAGNLPKCLSHGVSMKEIELLFAGEFVVVREAEINGERRLHGFGRVEDRWIFCVFSWRGPRVRPISVRYMHGKEVRRHAEFEPRPQDDSRSGN